MYLKYLRSVKKKKKKDVSIHVSKHLVFKVQPIRLTLILRFSKHFFDTFFMPVKPLTAA
jgi:hypothetical protein